MKRILSLLLLAMLAVTMVLPVLAADENGNTCATVLEIPKHVKQSSVAKIYHLQEEDLMEIIAQENEVIPEEAKIEHLTMIRQRHVDCGDEPFDISLRSWGTPNRYLILMYRPGGFVGDYEYEYDEEQPWEILACEWGNFIDGTIPGDGQYVLAWSW